MSAFVAADIGSVTCTLPAMSVTQAAGASGADEYRSSAYGEPSSVIDPRRALLTAGIVAVAIGLGLRVWFLGFPMRYDEAHNYLEFTSRSPSHIIRNYESPNNHILHSLMVRATTPLLGDSPPALRIPALAAGLLLIPLAGLLSWRLFERTDGVWLTMLAVATSSAMVEYSTNSRGYTWMALFSTLALIWCLRIVRGQATAATGIQWGVWSALGTYTIPVMAVPAVAMLTALGIASLCRGEKPQQTSIRRAAIWGATSWVVLSALLYSPVVLTQGVGMLGSSASLSQSVYRDYLADHGGQLGAAWSLWTRHASPGWIAICLVGAGAGAMGLIAGRSVPALSIVGPFVLVSGLVAWGADLPLAPANWVFLIPLLFALAGGGWGFVWEWLQARSVRRGWISALVVVISVGALDSGATVAEQDYLSAWEHEFVDAPEVMRECKLFGLGKCAVVAPYHPALNYYAGRIGFPRLRAPKAPDVRRVYIAATPEWPLHELWGPHVAGYERFQPPRYWRVLQRCRLYVAERTGEVEATVSATAGGDSTGP